jgi:enterochelin esterase family protein
MRPLIYLLTCLPVFLLAEVPSPGDPVFSPQIQPDHNVTFRLKAPEAKAVGLRAQWTKEKLALTKADDGTWSLTTTVSPGVWEYGFNLDGVAILDPANPAIKPQRQPNTSILSIPGNPANVWDFQNVPHGTVTTHTYLSKGLNTQRSCDVYTPPGYSEGTQTYPLLVLQHGSSDNFRTWTVHGKANLILDNLIASGKATPMVILMIDGHPHGMVNGTPEKRDQAMDAFRHELVDDAIPIVEKSYRVSKDQQQRALAGLSMGGMHTLTVGLTGEYPFAYLGAFSAAPPSETYLTPILANAEKANAKIKLLWLSIGQDDFLLQRNQDLIAKFKTNNLKYEFRTTPGDHSWPVWRNYLAEFAPKLFR